MHVAMVMTFEIHNQNLYYSVHYCLVIFIKMIGYLIAGIKKNGLPTKYCHIY